MTVQQQVWLKSSTKGVELWDIVKLYCSQILSHMLRVLIDLTCATDDVPCHVRILFIWLGRIDGDGS